MNRSLTLFTGAGVSVSTLKRGESLYPVRLVLAGSRVDQLIVFAPDLRKLSPMIDKASLTRPRPTISPLPFITKSLD